MHRLSGRPGRCALRSALRRFAPSSNLFFGSHPPRPGHGGIQNYGGGGGLLHASGVPPSGSLRPAQRSPALRAFVEPLFRFSSSPTWPRRDTKLWWRGEDSNLRRLSRQIYSLIPLTAREPLQKRGGILWQGSGAVNWAYRPRRLLAVSTCGMRHGSIAALAGAHGQFPQSTAATGSNSRF